VICSDHWPSLALEDGKDSRARGCFGIVFCFAFCLQKHEQEHCSWGDPERLPLSPKG
jgi:hypothetical protein